MHELAELEDEARVKRFLGLADKRRTPQWQAEHAALWQNLASDGLAALRQGDEDPASRAGAERQMAARRGHDTWERLPQLAMPVAVFAGRFDAIAPPDVQYRLAGQIAGAGYREFDGGHLFFVQDPTATRVVLDSLLG
jgi:3-oxoadipate enol-lactonase